MSLPAGILSAIASRSAAFTMWLEIEGIPHVFSTRAFVHGAGRQVVPCVMDLPAGVEAEVDVLEGSCSIGELSMRLMEDAGGVVLSLLGGSGRSDGWSRMQAPLRKSSFAYLVGDSMRPTASATGAYADQWWVCTAGGVSAGAEPAYGSTVITDGTVQWTAIHARAVPPQFIAAGADVLRYLPFEGPHPAPNVGSVFYVGRETFVGQAERSYSNRAGYQGGWVQVHRARFAAPDGSAREATAHTEGDIVSTYPRFLATRRAALMMCAGTDYATRFVRWAGSVVDAREHPSGGFEITMQSADAKLRVMRFANQIVGKLAGPVSAGDGSYDGADAKPPANVLLLEKTSVQGRSWATANEVVHLRVGDEIVCGRLQSDGCTVKLDDPTTYPGDARGCFGTVASQHEAGDEVRECFVLAGRNTSAGAEYHTRFTGGSSHPIDLVLALLLSTGTGANTTRDVLPAWLGAGLPAAEVDVDGALALRDLWLPGAEHVEVVTEPFVVKDLVSSILKPHGCFLVPRLNNVLAIGRILPPLPGATLKAVTASNVLAPPSWDAGLREVVGRVIFRCDVDPMTGEARQIFKAEIVGPGLEAQEFYAGAYKEHEVEARGQWSGNVPSAPAFGSRLWTAAFETFIRLLDTVALRYARPLPAMVAECSYDCLDVEVGDLVSFTDARALNPSTGARGFSAATCLVLRKQVADATGKVHLTLMPAPIGAQARYVAPSLILSAGGSATATLPVSQHAFTDAAGPNDTDYFDVGMRVDVRSADLATLRSTGFTILSKTATSITLDGALTFQAGDVVLPMTYSGATAAMRSRFAYLAGASGLIASADAGHEMTS